jgi:uncharacterized pyridoxamine 5'-phosphate oxidase family protein
MNEVVSFLQANPLVSLATTEGNQPRVRLFQIVDFEDGTINFCTGKHKDFYKQASANNLVEFCAFDPKSHQWMRVSGTAGFDDNPALLERVFKAIPWLKDVYTGERAKNFTMLKIKVNKALLCQEGKPARELTF